MEPLVAVYEASRATLPVPCRGVTQHGTAGRRLRRLRLVPQFPARLPGSSGNPWPGATGTAGEVDGPHPPPVDQSGLAPNDGMSCVPVLVPSPYWFPHSL